MPKRTHSVNLTKYVQTAKGPRYCPAVVTPNGRIKQDVVLVAGEEERHPEGAYYLDWRENRKRIRLAVGKNAADAQTQCQRKEYELSAVNHGVIVQPANGSKRKHLAVAVSDYLDEIKATKKPGTLSVYRTSLSYFQQSCDKTYLDEVDRKDMLAFSVFLREKDQGPRSVHNKFLHVLVFLKNQGIPNLAQKNDRPRYTDEEPEIYERAELDTLFAACNVKERLWFEFFLMTGMREQEVMHTCWSDVNLLESVVRVTHKRDFNWTPKAYKEREIPIPTALVTRLQEAKETRDKTCPLVFHTSRCGLKQDFWICLRAVAERAGLDPENFWLHKFRATFCTWALWIGVDLRTVMMWMGHSDIKSTMRYMKPSRSQQTKERVNLMFGGAQ